MDDLGETKGLFERLAASLAGEEHPKADDEIAAILAQLGYSSDRGADIELKRQRIALLMAASQFVRVFRLGSPDAPGLFFFGAEVSPGIVDPMHHQHPRISASGAGLSLRQAFEGCIGEGIEYLSQFETADDGPWRVALPDGLASLDAQSSHMVSRVLAGSAGQVSDQIDWVEATQLSNARKVLFPVDLALRRPAERRTLVPPYRLSCGCAAGPSFEAAAVHGMLELIERDALSQWWRGGARGRLVAFEDDTLSAASGLVAQMRKGSGRRGTWLLDITTDLDVPSVVAISSLPDGRGIACGFAARTTLGAAAQSALVEMGQMELAYAVVEAKRREGSTLSEYDQLHVTRRSAIDAARCELLHPVAPPRRHREIAAATPAQALASLVERLSANGIETYAIDLTRPAFQVPVVRIIAPCLQLEPCDVMTERLMAVRKRTGGGEVYTQGISLL